MKKLFQTVCETPINAPKEAFNLHDWVFTLSDKDYQTTARGHIAAGSSIHNDGIQTSVCLLYTSPSPRDRTRSRMPSSA